MKSQSKVTLALSGLGLGLFSMSFAPQGMSSFDNIGPVVELDGLPAPGTLGGPVKGLTTAQLMQWARGRKVFDRDFNEGNGLGNPDFNADSCRACHQQAAVGGSGSLELNVSRFGNDNGGAGPFTDLPGGQGLSKFRPAVSIDREEYDDTTADVFEQRQTPTVIGDGFINNIPAINIVANEDPLDANGDGIFGVARRLTINGNTEVGRFGWKGQIPKLRDFVRDAMTGECGITTPDDGRGFGQAADGDGIADPELTLTDLDDIAFFMEKLAPPKRIGSQDADVLLGEQLFSQIGCAKCHIPNLKDNTNKNVPLYSDLLLHDVLPANFRGMSETGAETGLFKTPPLWGIRHTAPYFHDGRATTLLDAILSHESEANGVRLAFEALSQSDQDAVIAFLNDL